MEQLVARRAHNPKVTGSSPVLATPKDSEDFSSESFFVIHPTSTKYKYRDISKTEIYNGFEEYGF